MWPFKTRAQKLKEAEEQQRRERAVYPGRVYANDSRRRDEPLPDHQQPYGLTNPLNIASPLSPLNPIHHQSYSAPSSSCDSGSSSSYDSSSSSSSCDSGSSSF